MERAILRLQNAEKTRLAGQSLRQSWYGSPVLYLTGPVGGGKTTFLQGLGEALDLPEAVLSPTFALAQPHLGRDGLPLVTHVDLYRLDENGARDFMRKFQWDGMLWVEWADRLKKSDWFERHMHLHFSEDGDGRKIEVTFSDAPLPSSTQVDEWRQRVGTPSNVIAHCEAVGQIAGRVAELLLERGMMVRPDMARLGGRLHDTLRYVDFLHTSPTATPEQLAMWQPWKDRYAGLRHEAAMAQFLREEGFSELSDVVRTHGILPATEPTTIEQRIVFYADKRAIGSKIVTVAERFEDFGVRYEGSGHTKAWEAQTIVLEKELFPEGPPSVKALTTPPAPGSR